MTTCTCPVFLPYSAIHPLACASCGGTRPADDPQAASALSDNSLYEYRTRTAPYSPRSVSAEFDQAWEAEGWRRVWADVAMEGVFIVYRRERHVRKTGLAVTVEPKDVMPFYRAITFCVDVARSLQPVPPQNLLGLRGTEPALKFLDHYRDLLVKAGLLSKDEA